MRKRIHLEFLFIHSGILLLAYIFILVSCAHAAPQAWDKNTILCDHDFDYANTLTEADIQAMFDDRNSFFKDYIDPSTGKLASWVIADRAQAYDINAQVILAKIQHETSSVWTYQDLSLSKIFGEVNIGQRVDWLLSYGLPDSGPAQMQFKGFYKQVDNAARTLKDVFDNPSAWGWVVGGQRAVNDGIVTPTNRATVSLYSYTPWIGDNPTSGNKLFYLVWKMMFGETGDCSEFDIVFAFDTTGSMWDDIDAVKTAAVEIVETLAAKLSDYRIAIVDYRDFDTSPYGGAGDYPYKADLPFSRDKNIIISAIQNLSIGWGADWAESAYSGLIMAINTEGIGSWRNGTNVKKRVIWLHDAPPHDPEPFTGYILNDVIVAAENVDPAIIYPIVVGGDPIAYAYASTIAEGTGGKVFSALSAADVVQEVLSAIETSTKSPIAYAGGFYSGSVGSPITFYASGSFDPDGTIVSYEWDWDHDGTYDETATSPSINHTWNVGFKGTVRLQVTDNEGLMAVDVATVEIISSNRSPVAKAGSDQVIECTSPVGTSTILDGSGSYDPDGNPLTYVWDGPFGIVSSVNPAVTLPLGASMITLTVNDGQFNSTPDSVNIVVQDTILPDISVTCSPDVLWPPNHKMVEIIPTITVSDVCDASVNVELYQIMMNEGDETNAYDPNYDGTLRDWNTINAIEVDLDGRIYLRAERSGRNLEGRKYTITYKATDVFGNSTMNSCEILVPHDLK